MRHDPTTWLSELWHHEGEINDAIYTLEELKANDGDEEKLAA